MMFPGWPFRNSRGLWGREADLQTGVLGEDRMGLDCDCLQSGDETDSPWWP